MRRILLPQLQLVTPHHIAKTLGAHIASGLHLFIFGPVTQLVGKHIHTAAAQLCLAAGKQLTRRRGFDLLGIEKSRAIVVTLVELQLQPAIQFQPCLPHRVGKARFGKQGRNQQG